MKIVIGKVQVETIPWTKNGRSGEFHQQSVMVELEDGQRIKALFGIEDPAKPYAPGTYAISEDSWHVDGRGRLGLRDYGVSLTPIAEPVRKAG